MVPKSAGGGPNSNLRTGGVGGRGPRGSRGHLWDPFVPSGWFDETSDDS